MRYLAATDGSAESDEAIALAARHASAFDATLEVVHVLTPETKLIDGEVVMPGEETAAEEGERVLQQAAERATETAAERGHDLAVETELLAGRPAAAIADRAEAADVDAIYVGHRGLSEERERVVGSVAKSVLDKADVPVTVVR